MLQCKLHPNYKATRRPTSKRAGCSCADVYAAKPVPVRSVDPEYDCPGGVVGGEVRDATWRTKERMCGEARGRAIMCAIELRRQARAAAPVGDPHPHTLTYRERVHAFERAIIEDALHRCGGNIAAAARDLGTRRSTLHWKMGQLRIVHVRMNGKIS